MNQLQNIWTRNRTLPCLLGLGWTLLKVDVLRKGEAGPFFTWHGQSLDGATHLYSHRPCNCYQLWWREYISLRESREKEEKKTWVKMYSYLAATHHARRSSGSTPHSEAQARLRQRKLLQRKTRVSDCQLRCDVVGSLECEVEGVLAAWRNNVVDVSSHLPHGGRCVNGDEWRWVWHK